MKVLNQKTKWILRISMIVLLLAGLTGCKDYTDGKTVHQKLDFTICENRCLPDELLDMIQKKKK